MNGRSMTFQVVSLGTVPREDGQLPTAQEVHEFLAEAAFKKETATFTAISLDDPDPVATQHEFIVRVGAVDYDIGVFQLINQHNRLVMIDAPHTSTKMSIEFDVINP